MRNLSFGIYRREFLFSKPGVGWGNSYWLEPFLKEAYRVLVPGGVALISVPYFHPLRTLKARLKLYRVRPDGLEFYQYAFEEGEFTNYLCSAGFRVVDKMVYDGFKGIKDEISLLRWMSKWPGLGRRLEKGIRSWKWAERHLGHMILFVCQKGTS